MPSYPGNYLCIRSQNEGIESLGCLHRCIIYTTGVVEALMFGGCIFGWAQLVYVLKNEGIFSHLCGNHNSTGNSTLDDGNGLAFENLPEHLILSKGENANIEPFLSCEEQDKEFAFIFTLACVAFGVPAFCMGLILHICGLATGRMLASLLLTLGFVALGSTTKDNPHWLYLAMICLALGGNQMRMAGLQFCDLFPRYRCTALTIISGSYAASAGFFAVFQIGQQRGTSLRDICLIIAGIALLSCPLTLLMPWHHIPRENIENNNRRIQYSVANSVFSFSGLAQIFWKSINLTAFTSYTLIYNSWSDKIAKTNEEAGHYSTLFGVSAFCCPLVSPFPGMLMDYLAKAPPGATEEQILHRKLRSTIFPLASVTIMSLILRGSLFFHSSGAIYSSLVSMILLRPSVFAAGNAFIKIRFPAEHFDRIVGIQDTVICSINALQYYLFVWTQNEFITAMTFFICLITLTFIHPLHLTGKRCLKKILDSILQSDSDERECIIQA